MKQSTVRPKGVLYMSIFIGVQLFTIGLFFLLGWAIRVRKQYSLISGFANRPIEEQQQLIENGYPEKLGNLLIKTAIGMVLLLPLSFTGFTYTIEVQSGFMLVFLLGGTIYLTKYETPRKRKLMYWISSITFILVIGFVGVLYYLGYQDNELIMKDNRFEITGIYGDEWDYKAIESVKLLEEMPKVTYKSNGFGMATIAKGYFKVKDYGSSLLFIRKGSPPYLYIKVSDQNIFINSENDEVTKDWYEGLGTRVKK